MMPDNLAESIAAIRARSGPAPKSCPCGEHWSKLPDSEAGQPQPMCAECLRKRVTELEARLAASRTSDMGVTQCVGAIPPDRPGLYLVWNEGGAVGLREHREGDYWPKLTIASWYGPLPNWPGPNSPSVGSSPRTD